MPLTASIGGDVSGGGGMEDWHLVDTNTTSSTMVGGDLMTAIVSGLQDIGGDITR